LLKAILTPLLKTPLLLAQPISMTPKDKLLKMPVKSLVFLSEESSMNQLPLLLLTVLTKKLKVKEMYLSSILVVVLLMYPSSLLMMVSLKSKLLPVTLISVVKISIKNS
jgi:hypothetical protein